MNFKPTERYNLIVSISTLEHVGWDETPRDPEKVIRAIDNLRACLAPGGTMAVTLPWNYNTALDNMISNRRLLFNECLCLKRVTADNQWVQVSLDDLLQTKYNSPFPAANAIVFGIIHRS